MFKSNIDSIVKKLQNLANEWSGLFENKTPMEIRFESTSNNLLTVNGTVLCPVSEIDADAATFDVEFFFLPTISGNEYEIYLHCPADGPSEIGYIKLISTVYSAGSQQTA